MAQIKEKSLQDVLDQMPVIRNEKGEIIYRRFNKQKFTSVLNAMAIDPEFKADVLKIRKGEISSKEEIYPTKEFRKWVKMVVESLGIDSSESKIVLTDAWNPPALNWMYDFIAEAIYIYIKNGCRFDLHAKEDFAGSLYLKEIAGVTKTVTVQNPQTHEKIGEFEITKEPHTELKTRSSCPAYMTHKKERV